MHETNEPGATAGHRRATCHRTAQQAACALAVASLGGLLATGYVGEERTIYYWDFVGWWERSTLLGQMFRQSPSQAFKVVLDSIATSDYNLVAAILPALWSLAIGTTRASFVVGLVVIYGSFSAVALAWLSSTWMTRPPPHDQASDEVGRASLCVAFIPYFVWLTWSLPFVTAMRGFVDLGACGLAFLCLALHVSRRELSWNAGRAVAAGAILALLFVFRRYWAFWITAYGVAISADAAYEAWKLRLDRSPVWFRPLATPCLAGFTAATVLAILALPLVTRALGTSYSDIYSAYQSSHTGLTDLIGSEVRAHAREVGIIPSVAGILAITHLCADRKSRRTGLLIATTTVLAYVQFRRVQAPGIQHYLLWTTGLIAAISIVGSHLTAKQGVRHAWITTFAICTAGLLQMAAACLPSATPIRFLVAGNTTQLPLHRNDLTEIDRLVQTLDKLDDEKAVEAIYCLSSSPTLNFTTLVGYTPATGKAFTAIRRLLPTADVDKRDGFPRGLLVANILIVADPPQTHLADSDQQIVTIPARQVLQGVGFGAAFRRLPDEFVLDGDVRVALYQRRMPLAVEHALALSDALKMSYASRPFIYEYDFRAR